MTSSIYQTGLSAIPGFVLGHFKMGSRVGDYEVFLSFRGTDTRQGFTDVLYKYMSNANIRVFRDDNALRIGDKIDSIFGAIVNSKICIPIFSPNFVQSRYCMLEVTKMVELKKTIVPIFYHVTSDDVKLKTSLYAKDFQKLVEKYGNREVDKWKQALKEVVSYKGKKVGNKGYCEFCEEFVDEVLSKLRPRGLEIVSVGINGMGGIGPALAPTPISATFGAPVTVLGQEFVAPYPVDLIFRKNGILSFDVKDSNGTIIFKVKHRFSSFNSKLLDASGKTILTMEHKVFSLFFNTRVFRGESTDDKDLLFKVKFSEKRWQKLKTKFTIHVFLQQNPSNDVWDYRVEGSWVPERSCVIYAGNTNDIVAQITHKNGTVQSTHIGNESNDHFGVTVYPGIDYAFIVAVAEFVPTAFQS